MKGRWVSVLALLMAMVLGGCAGFPSSGPVETVSEVRPDGRPRGIDVAAQAPGVGASPEAILEGFFAAAESPGDSFMVARQYLTPESAGLWRPESGIAVYDATGQSRVVTADGAAVLRAPLVGRVDVDHVFTAVHEPDFTHNFQMTKVNGEWRIGDPGPGILMSIQRFHRAFQSVPVYYLDPSGQRLVSQQVFLRQTELNPKTPDALVRAVIEGPGPWLRPSVSDSLPTAVLSSGTWVDVNGVAHVSLSEEMEALSAEQRLQAAAQLLYTLRYFESIEAVRITVNSRPLSIVGANADGVVPLAAVARFSSDGRKAAPLLVGIRGGSVITVSDAPRSQATPLPGPLGSGWADTPGQVAASWQGDQLGVVSADAQRLFTASMADGVPWQVFSGTQLVKPQFDATGQLWTVDNSSSGPSAVRVGLDGSVDLLPMPALAGSRVLAFRLSPDLTRMAVVSQFGTEQRFGLVRLRGADHLFLDEWRELPLNTSLGRVTLFRDVAFVSAQRMLVLGAGERDPQFTVYSLDVDAALVTSQGPIGDVEATSLTAMPLGTMAAVAVVTAANRGLRYEAQYRWPLLIEDVSDLAYPS